MGAMAVATAIASVASVLVAGQAPPATARTAAAANSGTALKTPWGEPDLQGIWNNPVVTPLERPAEFGTREFLTEAEAARLQEQLLESNKRPGRDSRTVGGLPAVGTEKDSPMPITALVRRQTHEDRETHIVDHHPSDGEFLR
jgi:hypothetical protein